jgi:hypothetical protein
VAVFAFDDEYFSVFYEDNCNPYCLFTAAHR